MKSIDLNVDVGEGFPYDEELIEIATSANVCCGAHAGLVKTSRTTAKICERHGVRIGAHPGIPDRATIGRTKLPPLDKEQSAMLLAEIVRQVEFLKGLGAMYIKPHGELYNASADRDDVCNVVTGMLEATKLPLMGLPGSLHERAAKKSGVSFIREGFVDRAYNDRGRLVPRSSPGAVVTDLRSVQDNALGLAAKVDSLCVHGDTLGCVEIARSVRRALESAGYQVKA